jgi:hypothetical protein
MCITQKKKYTVYTQKKYLHYLFRENFYTVAMEQYSGKGKKHLVWIFNIN